MNDVQAIATLEQLGTIPEPNPPSGSSPGSRVPWRTLPFVAQLYVATVILAGTAGLTISLPHSPPPPLMFVVLLLFACLTSAWKVTLPIGVAVAGVGAVTVAVKLTD